MLDNGYKRIIWNAYEPVSGLTRWPNGELTFHTYSLSEDLSGVCANSFGNLYAVNKTNNMIMKFKVEIGSDGMFLNFVKSFGGSGDEIGKFQAPVQIALDRIGSIYIADSNNNRIQKLDYDGNPIFEIKDTCYGKLFAPGGIAVSPLNNHIYVADCGNNKIIRYNELGICISEVFNKPIGAFYKRLDIDTDGIVYVIDNLNQKLLIFDKDLNYIKSISGTPYKQFNSLVDISVNKSQNSSGNWIPSNELVVVEQDMIHIFNIGISIETVNISTTQLWRNETGNICYPVPININYRLGDPGGDVVVFGMFEGGYDKVIAYFYGQSPNPEGVFYTVEWDGKNNNNFAPEEGINVIVISAVDSAGRKAAKSIRFEVIMDNIPPVTNTITYDNNSSRIMNDKIYISSQTNFYLSGSDNVNGSGIRKYQYRVIKNGVIPPGDEGWVDVDQVEAKFHLLESDAIGDTDGIIDIQYRAIDNVYNTETAKTLTGIKIGWQQVADMWAISAHKVNDKEIWFIGNEKDELHRRMPDIMRFNGKDFEHVIVNREIEIQDYNLKKFIVNPYLPGGYFRICNNRRYNRKRHCV